MQTTMSLQEEPRGKTGVFAEGPRAQTGLRGGKLGAYYARIARGPPEKCGRPLISRRKMAIKRAMMTRYIPTPRQPDITARLAAARHPI